MAVHLLDGAAPSPLERLLDDYLMSCEARGLVPKSLRQYRQSLRSIFLPWCSTEGIKSVSELDRRALDRFTASLLSHRTAEGAPLSKHSVHTYIRPVRLMLTWASREGENVLAKPQLPRREKPVRDVLSRDEIDGLERALPNERDKLIIRIFGDCGLRLDELVKLSTKSITRSGRQAHLRVLGKRGRIRDVPLPPTLLRRLDRFIESRPNGCSTDRLFLTIRRDHFGEYEALTEGGVYQVVKDAAERSSATKRVFPHLLRHSWMTEMLRHGMNPIQLSIIAGASQDVIAQCYTHLNKDDAYEAMLRILANQKV
jgi:integrase/recombinase XerD